MLLSTIRSYGSRTENVFGKLKVDLHQFQNTASPLPSSPQLNLGGSKITLGLSSGAQITFKIVNIINNSYVTV